MYFLDTNTCIYYINGKYESIRDRILSTPPVQIRIPAVVKAELLLGAYKSRNKTDTLKKLNIFLNAFEIESFSDDMTYIYADIRSNLEQNGNIIGANDLFIASTVMCRNGILVTNNIKEFARIKSLRIENWVM